MALGLNLGGGSGSITPICKWDSRSGRMFIVNREDGQDQLQEVGAGTFKACMDLENIEVGSIAFVAGMAPDFHLVKYGEKLPPIPTENHKAGCRLLLKLSKELGGEVREIASTAKSFLRAMDELHNAYLAGVQANPNKLPIVILKGSTAVVSGEGQRKSTNWAPQWEIIGWAPRPQDLVYTPRTLSTPVAASKPPTTGSTPLAAPVAAVADPDDFG